MNEIILIIGLILPLIFLACISCYYKGKAVAYKHASEIVEKHLYKFIEGKEK